VRRVCNPTNDPEHECLSCEDEYEEWSERRFWAGVAVAVTIIVVSVLGIAYKISKLDLQTKSRVESTR
jgi:anti-sigma-K factor RskA